jgi:hypothetical protein
LPAEAGHADQDLTTSVAVAWCVSVPLFPVTLSVNVPRVAERMVRTVSVDVPGGRSEIGAKLAVAPEPSPLAARLTVPAKPAIGETVTVYAVA